MALVPSLDRMLQVAGWRPILDLSSVFCFFALPRQRFYLNSGFEVAREDLNDNFVHALERSASSLYRLALPRPWDSSRPVAMFLGKRAV
jgi:hypothetical protein